MTIMENMPVDNIRTMKEIDDEGVYKTLLESTKAIPWKINWQTKQFDYIGPQIEELLGWSQNSWLAATDWIERIHPEDREYTVNFCVSQSEDGVDHEADYRALKADGGYVWIRDVVHVIRNGEGVTTSLVGFMFDISERKKMEQELVDLNNRLQVLTGQDSLTGVANRRLFNQTLENEWSRMMRSQKPISLIMFDLDHFKQYNDQYGHLMGDECLVKISKIISDIPMRSTDLFARFGGEEFVVVLPETDQDAAVRFAEKLRVTVQSLQVPHAIPGHSDYVTISVGISTMVPNDNLSPRILISEADKMLYQAKQNGRNRIHSQQA
jgi:diguanylate cyclase (GGDEF)-like protein/PAS domain S-box-containing protein